MSLLHQYKWLHRIVFMCVCVCVCVCVCLLQRCHAYEPIQDTDQLHRTFLTRLTDHVMGLWRHTDHAHSPTHTTQHDGTVSVLPGLCETLSAVLQLEHRALTAALSALWTLLAAAAALAAAPVAAAGAASRADLTDATNTGKHPHARWVEINMGTSMWHKVADVCVCVCVCVCTVVCRSARLINNSQ